MKGKKRNGEGERRKTVTGSLFGDKEKVEFSFPFRGDWERREQKKNGVQQCDGSMGGEQISRCMAIHGLHSRPFRQSAVARSNLLLPVAAIRPPCSLSLDLLLSPTVRFSLLLLNRWHRFVIFGSWLWLLLWFSFRLTGQSISHWTIMYSTFNPFLSSSFSVCTLIVTISEFIRIYGFGFWQLCIDIAVDWYVR